MGSMAFTFSTPAGIAGTVSRPLDSEVESVQMGTAFTAYGQFCTFDGNGKVAPVVTSTVAAGLKGVLVRSVPSIAGSIAATFNQMVPNTDQFQGRLTHGYVSVACTIGTPVKGGIVYVRVVAATGKVIGDIEATADGSNNIAVLDCEWAVNGKDSNNISEIFVKVS